MALTDNLVAYWKFDGNGNDSVGSNTLTAVNSPTYTTGKQGQAANLVGASSQAYTIADNTTLRVFGVDFTIALWFYIETGGVTQVLLEKGGSSAATVEYWLRLSTANSLNFLRGNGTTSSSISSSNLSTQAWHLAIASYDHAAGTGRLRIDNGTAVTGSLGEFNGTTLMAVGRLGSGTTQYFTGRVDELAIWKGRQLSTTEETQLYNGGAGLTYPFGGIQRVGMNGGTKDLTGGMN